MNPSARLVEMANDIAANLAAYPEHADAVNTMVVHLQRFWEPTMRERIVQYLQAGGDDLSPLARDAIENLSHRLNQTPPPTKRGVSDAG
ncbi:formate dehydrogenase subunit delta [Solilutibacter silvestris]|uniref:NADH-dependent formate dehydrogenase delta subunit FdsD n=1 Tax=Solilutibacter silvestris TaxID=1645665 RepID=A0A2K1PYC9_9GAMM|nr:formate dehydrogenase subunit delta [Lysobacter silvestris]PNS07788.1 NADH-dependent formate dehydrogenase delta subunit FdsD [Lysobacter silvestris]